ncbi:hypothetical protein ACN47E_002586 [Coniothyrium glycines]
MVSEKDRLNNRTWTKDNYLISTDPSRIPISRLNTIFASDTIYWANPLPESVARETLENSLCFGLYDTPPNTPSTASNFIGFARCITDFTTFVYLTDVYIDPSRQGKGLGAWLIGCVQEAIEAMPHLRRSMLFTSDWARSVPFYETLMGMSVVECTEGSGGPAIMQRRGPAWPLSLG